MTSRPAVFTDLDDRLDTHILASRIHVLDANADAVSQYIPVILGEIFKIGLSGPVAMAHSEIALSEALNNIVEHSYAGATGQISVRSVLTEQEIWFEVTDAGKEMPNLEPPNPSCPENDVELDELPEGGFGWFLIRNLVKDLEYHRRGDQNHLKFSVSRFQ